VLSPPRGDSTTWEDVDLPLRRGGNVHRMKNIELTGVIAEHIVSLVVIRNEPAAY
jgi:hypothetical protein